MFSGLHLCREHVRCIGCQQLMQDLLALLPVNVLQIKPVAISLVDFQTNLPAGECTNYLQLDVSGCGENNIIRSKEMTVE